MPEELNALKTRGLMQVIERIIAKHHRGTVVLDEDTFKLYEIAKSISWANSYSDLGDAMKRLE